MSTKPQRGAQILTILLALPMTIGSLMFSVISPDHHEAAWKTWTLAPIAFACGIGLLVLAPQLVRGGPSVGRRMLALLCIAQAFSLIKLIAFHETAAIPFIVVGAAAIVLLRVGERPGEVLPQA